MWWMSLFMRRKNSTDDLSIEEIKRQLSIKQQVSSQKRWQRLKQAGRVVDIPNYPPPVLSRERLPSNGRFPLSLATVDK
jgi:hypothetical protein